MVRFARPGLIACFAVAMSLLPCTRIVLGQDDTTPSDDNQTASVNATASPDTWLQSPAIVGTAIANTFSPSPRVEVGPWDYPHGINPLTGLPYPNDEALKRRNLIVKVSNWPPRVRPQHAVNQADLVYEYEAEGGVTRFAAIYRNNAPEQVGSIRSAPPARYRIVEYVCRAIGIFRHEWTYPRDLQERQLSSCSTFTIVGRQLRTGWLLP